MEQKKKLLIKVLTKLKPYRNLAEGILALVESVYITDKTIDGILKIMASALKRIRKKQEKEKIETGINLIKKIKKYEEEESEDIDQELEEKLKDI